MTMACKLRKIETNCWWW